MHSEIDEFVSVGMAKYRRASAVLVAFGKEIERRLHSVLLSRRTMDWGSFIPDDAKLPRSMKFWSEYPFLNAKMSGKIGDTSVHVMIAVNWYQAEGEYPLYCAYLEPLAPYESAMAAFDWVLPVKWEKNGIALHPNEEDFALERDFGLLLDELMRFLKGHRVEGGA